MNRQNIKFIAEVSSNHNQSLERCYAFIDAAAQIGCSSVKFQLFKLDQLFSPEVFVAKPEIEARRKWELPVEFLPFLSKYCKKKNIEFGCTPFYLQAVNELEPYVDFFKIASYELIWPELLTACAATGKPLVLSTGMATLREIYDALNLILEITPQLPITLLHCVSSYPTPPKQCNLSAIQTLRIKVQKKYAHLNPQPNIQFGWSDHSVSPPIVHRAVHHWGAHLIEFHLDLDSKGAEFKQGHCWLPHQMKVVIEQIQIALQADGNGQKEPLPTELPDREWRADPSDGLRPLHSVRNRLIREHNDKR